MAGRHGRRHHLVRRSRINRFAANFDGGGRHLHGLVLGVVFVTRWPEERFEPAAAGRRWSHGTAILRRGVSMARADRMIFLVLAGTLLVNGEAQVFGRLFESRLIDLGMPTDPDPIVSFAALALLAAALGAIALRFVEARVHGADVARQTYVLACAVGVVGLVVFAHAPSTPAAVAGALPARASHFHSPAPPA